MTLLPISCTLWKTLLCDDCQGVLQNLCNLLFTKNTYSERTSNNNCYPHTRHFVKIKRELSKYFQPTVWRPTRWETVNVTKFTGWLAPSTSLRPCATNFRRDIWLLITHIGNTTSWKISKSKFPKFYQANLSIQLFHGSKAFFVSITLEVSLK